jgi:hypothetical protein
MVKYVSDNLQYLYDNRFDPNKFDYDPLSARATSNLAVATYRQDIPNCTITLDRNGTWTIWGIFGTDLQGVSDADVIGELAIANVAQTGVAYIYSGGGVGGTLMQKWTYECVAAPKVAKLQCYSNNIGASVLATNTVILAYCGSV